MQRFCCPLLLQRKPMGSQFTFLTYKYRDASFQVHPFLDFSWTGHLLNFTISPYEDRRTSLQVVNGSLYLFCTMARASAGPSSYTSYLSKIDTQDWTIKESDQLTLDLPPLFAPGVEVSDGNNLFIIGGLSSIPIHHIFPGKRMTRSLRSTLPMAKQRSCARS